MTSHLSRTAAPLLVALALAAPLGAQTTPPDTARADTLRADTTTRAASTPRAAQPDTARPRHRISPRGAFIRSLILPGWGQSEIGSPERGVIYFALEAGSLWMVLKSNHKLQEAYEREEILIRTGQLEEGRTSNLVRARRAQREDWLALSLFWLFFSGADAFVGAHLRDFDAQVEAGPGGRGVQVGGSIPVGRRP